MKQGFDNEQYVKLQSDKIKQKMKLFPHRLYLEFGGKLFDDYHAARVLPGFELNAKIRLLQELKEEAEVIFCINANDIELNKMRADHGITYDMELLRLMIHLQNIGILVNSVVITLFDHQPSAIKFKEKLEKKGIKTYLHKKTRGYPTNVDLIVSEEGYGANAYIETTKKLVIVTAPGASSGKLATCLSQLYHEYKMGMNSGYAKFETFPIWDLSLKHPINLAYEAATADIEDKNMIDYFHLEKYGIKAVNYNRDLEVFPIIKTILHKITGTDIYASPTDMGVNTIRECITNEELVIASARQEIIRRYYKENVDLKLGFSKKETVERIQMIMNELSISESERPVIAYSLNKMKEKNRPIVALQLPNGKIITGKKTNLLTPAASMALNALKELTQIPDTVDLISNNILDPILKLKNETLQSHDTELGLQEVLIALSICSATNPIVEQSLKNLKKLESCEAHATYIVGNGDLKIVRTLNIHLTCEPIFDNDN